MEDLIEMLKRHEGEVVTNGRHLIYKCSAGYWTLGIGRNVDVNGGLGLSDDEVDYLLENDIARVIKELSLEYSWFSDLDQTRKALPAETTAFSKSSALKAHLHASRCEGKNCSTDNPSVL